jgi:hypothetical protein
MEQLESIVAEVTNTPWGERHLYVLDAGSVRNGVIRTASTKQLHVSPFLTMDYVYQFRLTTPGRSLTIHIANTSTEDPRTTPPFDATAVFRRRAMTGSSLARMLCRYPFMTAQVAAAIYWQAFLLWIKGAPYVPHPQSASTRDNAASPTGFAPGLPTSFRQDAERPEGAS